MKQSGFIVKAFSTTLLFSALLFFCAGRISYYQGWIFLCTNLVATLVNFLSIRNDEALINERSQPGKGTKSWDKMILVLSALTYLLTLIIGGLDSGRYGRSPAFHWSLYFLGILFTFSGQVIFISARKKNRFFSTVVRIQNDRGHSVCDSGIYKFVRHPGYLGMIISLLALPLLLGSLLSIIPTLFSIILLLTRTYLEDETLKKELSGYKQYTQRTKTRLIPKVW
jgi:protein-S-isoprenylcysteine O-methyltransferase Ste14